MSANIKVEYTLNRIVNMVTEQNRIRLSELKRYPICLLFGEMPEDIRQMLELEMVSKIGNAEALKMISLDLPESVADKVADAIHNFRVKTEKGILQLNFKYYVPVIFFADKLNADGMEQCMMQFQQKMKNAGFDEDYQLVYYCIFNYEDMDGNKCKEQLEKLQGKETQCNYPICIFTQNHCYASDYQKYLKVIQSMAMHIFLQLTYPDTSSMPFSDHERKSKNFVVGYWKLDVLKQKMADYLMHCIHRQDKDSVEKSRYMDQIREIVDQIMYLDKGYWLNVMCHMPVKYNDVEEWMHLGMFSRKRNISYGQLLINLYGREDILTAFVELNLGRGTERHYIEEFMKRDIGNLYAVSNKLKGTLKELGNQYRAEKEKSAQKRKSYEDIYHFRRRCRLEEILGYLSSYYWEVEMEQIELERKIRFVGAVEKYLETDEFQKRIKEVRAQNEEEMKQLRLIRREVSMADENLVSTKPLKIVFSDTEKIPKWNEDIFEETSIENILDGIADVKKQVQSWMHVNLVEVLGDFVVQLQELKRKHQMELYYSARIDVPRDSWEKEYLYISPEYFTRRTTDKDLQEIKQIVGVKLPNVCVCERKWETEMCFELFTVKEIESFSEIYNID